MTIGAWEILLYAGGILALFLTPGPVWVALTARALSGGFASAWPLAVGVVLGDVLWPLLAIFGLTWILSVYGEMLEAMRWVAVVIFLVMGVGLVRRADQGLSADSRLTRPGRFAGFAAGVTVIIANPKAILFYMGVLPGFFDLSRVGTADILVILSVSIAIPLMGNLAVALFIDRARQLLRSPQALRKLNLVSGWLLILVGIAIAVA